MSYDLKLYDGSDLTTVEPLESNGVDNQSVPRAILDLDFGPGTNTFIVADDVTARFVAGFSFEVLTGPYSGSYVVDGAGSTYDAVSLTTSIPVTTPIVAQPLTVVGVSPGVGGIWKIEGAVNGDCVYYPGAGFTVAGSGAGDGAYFVASSEVSGAYSISAVDSGASKWTLTGDVTSFFDGGTQFSISSNNPGFGTYTTVSATLVGFDTEIIVVEAIPVTANTLGVASIVPAITRVTVTGSIALGAAGSGTATVPVSVAYPFSSPPTMLTNTAPNTYTIIWHLTGNHASKFVAGCPVIIKDNSEFDNLSSTVLTAVDNGANTDVTVQFKYPTTPSAPDATGTLTFPLPPLPYGFIQYEVLPVDSSLMLLGRGSPAFNNTITWGQALLENDIHIMENFRTDDGSPPVAPLAGQFWYDQLTPAMQLFASNIYDIISVTPGLGGTWEVDGNNLSPTVDPFTDDALEVGKTIIVYNDSGSGPQNEFYTIASRSSTGLNTADIVVNETIPDGVTPPYDVPPVTAQGDGKLYSFDDWHGVVVEGLPVQGDIDMNSFAIQNLADPVTAQDAASKAYVDALSNGIVWIQPVLDPNLFDDSLTAPPVIDPTIPYHKTYIVAAGGSGVWTGLDGRAVVYDPNTAAWVDILQRVVGIGDRFGVFCEPDNDDNPPATLPGGGLVGTAGKIATVASLGPITYTFYTPVEPDAFTVTGVSPLPPAPGQLDRSPHYGHSYTFRGTWGAGVYLTNYQWIEFSGIQMIVDGAGLKFSGNTLNVGEGFGIMVGFDDVSIDEMDIDTLYLRLDGTNSPMTGTLDMGGERIINVPTAVLSGHAVSFDEFDAHETDLTIHFTEASIDHMAIMNIGTNSHANIDSHISNNSIHFSEASIDHTAILNIGTNSHAAIDTHIADATIHFTQAAISITKSQLSDFVEADYVHVTGVETVGGVKTFTSAPVFPVVGKGSLTLGAGNATEDVGSVLFVSDDAGSTAFVMAAVRDDSTWVRVDDGTLIA